MKSVNIYASYCVTLCWKGKSENMANTVVQVGLPPEVVDLIDNDRGDITRSLYLRKLIIEEVYKRFNNCLSVTENKPA